MSEAMVRQSLLDEALRIGSSTVDKANKYLLLSRVQTEAIRESIDLLDTGRVDQARICLSRALLSTAKILS